MDNLVNGDQEEMKSALPPLESFVVDVSDVSTVSREATPPTIKSLTPPTSLTQSWSSLPSDLIAHLARCLDFTSLICLTRVDTTTRKTLIASEFLWTVLVDQLQEETFPRVYFNAYEVTQEFNRLLSTPSIIALRSPSPRQFLLVRSTLRSAIERISQRREVEKKRQDLRNAWCSFLSSTLCFAFLTSFLLTTTFARMLVQLTADPPQLTVPTFIPVFLLLAFCISMLAFHLWFHWCCPHPHVAPHGGHVMNLGDVYVAHVQAEFPQFVPDTTNTRTIRESCQSHLLSCRLPFISSFTRESRKSSFLISTLGYIHSRTFIPTGRTQAGLVSILLLLCIFVVLVILKVTDTMDASWTLVFIPMYVCNIPVIACLIWTMMLPVSWTLLFSFLVCVAPPVLANIRLVNEDQSDSNGGILLVYILLPLIGPIELPLFILFLFSCCASERVRERNPVGRPFIFLTLFMTFQILWILHVDRAHSKVPVYAVFIPMLVIPPFAFIDELRRHCYRFRSR